MGEGTPRRQNPPRARESHLERRRRRVEETVAECIDRGVGEEEVEMGHKKERERGRSHTTRYTILQHTHKKKRWRIGR